MRVICEEISHNGELNADDPEKGAKIIKLYQKVGARLRQLRARDRRLNLQSSLA